MSLGNVFSVNVEDARATVEVQRSSSAHDLHNEDKETTQRGIKGAVPRFLAERSSFRRTRSSGAPDTIPAEFVYLLDHVRISKIDRQERSIQDGNATLSQALLKSALL